MDWLQRIDIVARLLTSLALLVGGTWVLFNYIEGRIHRPRMQLRVSADRVAADGLEYLIVKTELMNVGLAKTSLIDDGCCLKVYAHRPLRRYPEAMEPNWKELTTIDLFNGQHWVEPAGLLIDQQLLAIPDVSNRFLRVLAHVELANRVAWNTHKVGLNAYAVVERRQESDPT
jgi:hypothetical protein